jgi:predicted transcriptional regulator
MTRKRSAKTAGLRLAEIRDLLGCEVVCGEERLEEVVTECFAADLMSDVLAFSKPRVLLITGLSGIQSVHTADVAELAGIVFVHRKRPSPQVIDLAAERGIPVLSTHLHMFDACAALAAKGLRGGSKG